MLSAGGTKTLHKVQTMAREVELSRLDLRYEGYRMKNAELEERLLGWIAQRGIQEPLEGVDLKQESILLNGCKRYRCARKLQIRMVPYTSVGPEEVVAIMNLLRISNHRTLSILEQAAFIDELKNVRRLSVREIEQLAHGYFRGPESFRQEILKGNLALPLKQIRQVPQSPDGCNEFERVLLSDLETTQKYMQRVMGKSQDQRIQSRAFHAQSNLLTAGILSRTTAFIQSMRQLHDRNGQT